MEVTGSETMERFGGAPSRLMNAKKRSCLSAASSSLVVNERENGSTNLSRRGGSYLQTGRSEWLMVNALRAKWLMVNALVLW